MCLSCGPVWKITNTVVNCSYGLQDEYDKLIASDIIALLIEGLKSIDVTRNKLVHTRLIVDDHNPGNPQAT